MERGDTVDRYKVICGHFLEALGLQVHVDVEISDTVRWRPHLFGKDGTKIVIDVLDSKTVPGLLLEKYIEAMNAVPGLEVSLAIIGDLNYLPDLFIACYKYGIGIIVIQNDQPKQILRPHPRQVQTLSENDQIAIMPSTPFGNVLGLRKCFRLCQHHINWLEVNLPKKVLEILYESIHDGDLNVRSIRLMRGVDDKLTTAFRNEFEDLRRELLTIGIHVQFRVIIDRSITAMIHGRYIYSTDDIGNDLRVHLPPVNSIKGHQWDTIFTNSKYGPPFDELWASAVDITLRWNEVANAVREHLKHKKTKRRTSKSMGNRPYPTNLDKKPRKSGISTPQ